ncbi:MAG: integral membrane protein, partial [Bacteroidia bacterium]
MIKAFRITSYLEGISYLLLLGVGVPLKYLAGNDVIVKSLGMPHGILFMAYIFLAIIIKQKVTWDTKTMIIVLI